jgi:hypothetical protein
VVFDNILVKVLSLREAIRGYLISLKASRYSPRYIEVVEMSLRLLADYAEMQGWREVGHITASHIEEYLVYLRYRRCKSRSPLVPLRLIIDASRRS